MYNFIHSQVPDTLHQLYYNTTLLFKLTSCDLLLLLLQIFEVSSPWYKDQRLLPTIGACYTYIAYFMFKSEKTTLYYPWFNYIIHTMVESFDLMVQMYITNQANKLSKSNDRSKTQSIKQFKDTLV